MRFSGFTSRCKRFCPWAACRPAEAASTVAQAAGGVKPCPLNRLHTVPAREKLHNQKAEAVFFDKIKDRHHMRMVEGSQQASLGDKTGPYGCIRGKSSRELLDCDGSA